MDKQEDYIYLDSFPQQIARNFELKQYEVKPKRTIMSREVRYADAILTETGNARMDGTLAEAQWMLDFGQEVVGTIELMVSCEHSSELKIYYGETYEEALRREPYTSGWYTLPQDIYRLNPGTQRLVNYGRRGFRYLHLTVPHGSGELTIVKVTAQMEHYPVQHAGHFSSSDVKLNRIWDISKNTTKLCMQQFYEDGLKRDGLLWVGDYRVQFLCNWYCFGDAELARKCLYMIASTQRRDGAIPACTGKAGGHQHPQRIEYMGETPHDFIDSWILFGYNVDFIQAVKEYVMFTGDRGLLDDLWPFVVRTFQFLASEAVNLYDLAKLGPTGVLTDTQLDEEVIWWFSHGAFLMMLICGCKDVQLLSAMMQDEETAQNSLAFQKRVEAVLIADYWLADERRFGDFYKTSKTSIYDQRPSQHLHAYSVLAGFTAPGQTPEAVLKRICSRTDSRYPVLGFAECWAAAAMYEAGMANEALNEMRSYYGYMLELGATTCWEKVDYKRWDEYAFPEAPLSYCHGWSAGPAYLFPTYILGLKPLSPGFAEIVIEPQLGDLQWAEGCLPTPLGEIYIRWEALDSGPGHAGSPDRLDPTDRSVSPGSPAYPLSGVVRLPAGISGMVKLPGMAEAALHEGLNRI